MVALWIELFLNLLDQNPSIETAAKIGLVVNSLNFKSIVVSLYF